MENIRKITQDYIKEKVPLRPSDGHKGTFGSVFLWAGSSTYLGAAHMCAQGALRSGVGLVYLLSPDEFVPFFSSTAPSLIVRGESFFEKPIPIVLDDLFKMQAVVIGSGILPGIQSLKRILPVLIEKIPHLLLDAGALTHISADMAFYRVLFEKRLKKGLAPVILSPHPGEFMRMAPDIQIDNRAFAAQAFAQKYGCIVILKGKDTVVAAPNNSIMQNTTGNNGLAKGGSGDVLAGLLGGFLAQGILPFDAACCAVYFHGLAGDKAAEHLGKRYMQPTDIPAYFPAAFQSCGW